MEKVISKSIEEIHLEKGRGPDKQRRKRKIAYGELKPIGQSGGANPTFHFKFGNRDVSNDTNKKEWRVHGKNGVKTFPSYQDVMNHLKKSYVIKSQVHVGPYQRAGHYVQGYSATRPEGIGPALTKEHVAIFDSEIEAPFVKAEFSTLGGPGRESIIVRVSRDPKEDWHNGIFQNSNYSIFHLNQGSMERFSGRDREPKFRKTKFKTVHEAIEKINKFLRIGKEREEDLSDPFAERLRKKGRDVYDRHGVIIEKKE